MHLRKQHRFERTHLLLIDLLLITASRITSATKAMPNQRFENHKP